MGREAGRLIFWKPRIADLSDPAAVLRSLEDGVRPDLLDDIDIDSVLTSLKRTYRAFKPPPPVEMDFPKQETAITVTWSPTHFCFLFEGDAFKQMDRVSLLMSKLGLACYDAFSQTSFVPDAPPRFIGSPDEEARWTILQKVLDERTRAIWADLGFTIDPKTGVSADFLELRDTDPERAKAIAAASLKRTLALTTGPEVQAEVDRRMALRAKRRSRQRRRRPSS